jgi:hypothetical protein
VRTKNLDKERQGGITGQDVGACTLTMKNWAFERQPVTRIEDRPTCSTGNTEFGKRQGVQWTKKSGAQYEPETRLSGNQLSVEQAVCLGAQAAHIGNEKSLVRDRSQGCENQLKKRKLQHACSLEEINDWHRNEIKTKSKKELRRKSSQQNLATRSTATLTRNTSSTNGVKKLIFPWKIRTKLQLIHRGHCPPSLI